MVTDPGQVVVEVAVNTPPAAPVAQEPVSNIDNTAAPYAAPAPTVDDPDRPLRRKKS